MKTLACCYGTRPEFIKIAPIVLELQRKYTSIKPLLICSGQHEELLDGLDTAFGIRVVRSLDIRKIIGPTDSLPLLAEASHTRFAQALQSINPDGVLVQGDAASSFLAAFAAFHLHIPVFYVEAGLRTYDLEQPFPEEAYRQLTSRLASYCFAPTIVSQQNLLNEGIAANRIFVVGNTVVDAVNFFNSHLQKNGIERLYTENFPWMRQREYRRLILVTVHRRENQGKVLHGILRALLAIQKKHPGDLFVFSVHPNPKVRLAVYSMLKNNPRFVLIHPPRYFHFLTLLRRASIVMTDSGGMQEEAPSFGIPTLVLRRKTERVEGIKSGWSVLAGVDTGSIMDAFERLDSWKKPRTGNPYGDGKAAKRIAKIINEHI